MSRTKLRKGQEARAVAGQPKAKGKDPMLRSIVNLLILGLVGIAALGLVFGVVIPIAARPGPRAADAQARPR